MSASRGGSRRRERGVATGLAAAGLLVLAALLAFAVGGLLLQVAAHRVQGAADLVALAGAQAKAWGGAEPCAAAARAAAADGVALIECGVAGDELSFVVTVTVRTSVGPLGAFGAALEPAATAHAGARVG